MRSLTSDWLSERAWHEIHHLASLPPFYSIWQQMASAPQLWRKFVLSAKPPSLETALPMGLHKELTSFQRLCLLRCLRPDCIASPALADYVRMELGEVFLTVPSSSVRGALEMCDEVNAARANDLLLKDGVDPTVVGNDASKKVAKANQTAAAESARMPIILLLRRGSEENATAALHRAGVTHSATIQVVSLGVKWPCSNGCHPSRQGHGKVDRAGERPCR